MLWLGSDIIPSCVFRYFVCRLQGTWATKCPWSEQDPTRGKHDRLWRIVFALLQWEAMNFFDAKQNNLEKGLGLQD